MRVKCFSAMYSWHYGHFPDSLKQKLKKYGLKESYSNGYYNYTIEIKSVKQMFKMAQELDFDLMVLDDHKDTPAIEIYDGEIE